VCREGVFDAAVAAIRAARRAGFRVTTNSTLFTDADPERYHRFFDEVMALGVEGMMISPGYPYAKAPDQDHFLPRRRSQALFRRILEARVSGNTHVGDDAAGYVASRMGAVREHRPLGGIHRLNSGQVISMTHQPMADGGWVSTHRDVTELYNMQAELTHLAYHDPLTGLPNRTLFYQRIGRAFDAVAESKGFAVLCLDLDGFKPINDMLGHATGDALLRQFAARLTRALGPKDTAALANQAFCIGRVAREVTDKEEVEIASADGISLPGKERQPARTSAMARLA
jgi:hypothetical protein